MKHTVLLLSALLGLAPARAAQVVNRALATVNGDAILQSEFEKTYASLTAEAPPDALTPEAKKENKRKLLDNMIEQKLLLQEAKKRKLQVTRRELESGILQVKLRFLPQPVQPLVQKMVEQQMAGKTPNTPEAAEGPDLNAIWSSLEKSNPDATKQALADFQKELNKEGLDNKRFEDRIKDQLLATQLTHMEVRTRTKPPTEAEVKALFDKIVLVMQGKTVEDPEIGQDLNDMAKFFGAQTGEKVRARHILVTVQKDASFKDKSAALKKAQDLKKKLDGGADFAELAEKNSDDKGSAQRGGDLGVLLRGQTVPAFEKAAFDLPVGKVSAVVESNFGYHIILVEEKKAASKLRYEDVKDDLGEFLFNAGGRKALTTFLRDLKKTATIKVNANLDEIGQ